MHRLSISTLAVCTLLGVATAAHAQDEPLRPVLIDDFSHARLVSVGLGVGAARAHSDATPTAFLRQNAVQGVARYTQFFDRDWALDISVSRFGLLDADAVMPVLLGAAYYPRALALGSRVRPYASLAGGVVFRQYDAGTTVGLDPIGRFGGGRASHGDPAPGARAGVGVDAIVGRRFVLGGFAGYHVSGPFPNATDAGRAASRATGPTAWISMGTLLPRRGQP